MGRFEDYLEMHGNDRYDDEEDEQPAENCSVCGTDYGKLYHFEGECLCENCLLDKYYIGDASDYPTISFCDRCGEPIEQAIYCVQNVNGDCEYFDEECLLDTAEER